MTHRSNFCPCGRPASRKNFNVLCCDRCYEIEQRYKSNHLQQHTAVDRETRAGLSEYRVLYQSRSPAERHWREWMGVGI